MRHIERYGKNKYFPHEEYHLIGDSAFPLRTWLMTPYKGINLNRMQKKHNYCLSSARVCVENIFALVKARFARLKYINTYSISKAIEITTSACILHNFCYRNNDEWFDVEVNHEEQEYIDDHDMEQQRLGREKRDQIARNLLNEY